MTDIESTAVNREVLMTQQYKLFVNQIQPMTSEVVEVNRWPYSLHVSQQLSKNSVKTA